jgi:shikimate dehydrogenase
VNDIIIQKELLHDKMLLMDIVYNSLKTKLIKEAKEVGVKTIECVDMFVIKVLKRLNYG